MHINWHVFFAEQSPSRKVSKVSMDVACCLKVFEAIGIKKNKAQAMFQAADADQDGTINCHEFIAWLTKQRLKVGLKQHTDARTLRVLETAWKVDNNVGIAMP